MTERETLSMMITSLDTNLLSSITSSRFKIRPNLYPLDAISSICWSLHFLLSHKQVGLTKQHTTYFKRPEPLQKEWKILHISEDVCNTGGLFYCIFQVCNYSNSFGRHFYSKPLTIEQLKVKGLAQRLNSGSMIV